jgi:putative ABC transport system permease protein
LAPKGGFDQNDILYFPYNTVRYRLSKDPTNIDEIIVQTDTADRVDQVVRAIQLSLERSHHIAKGTPDDFTVTTADQLFQQVQQETSALTVLLVGSIAISLIVGGIAVMNIMIASVTERTQEIGICMSIGAKQSDIRNQFLIEALLLCLVGAVCGLLVGLVVDYKAATSFGFPFVTTWLTFSLPLAVSSIVGLTFGLVPAMQASRLDPVTALRHANQAREAS